MRRAVAALALVALAACIRETPDVSQSSPSQSSTTTDNPQTGTTQNTATMNPTVPTNLDSPTTRIPGAAVGEQRAELLEYQIRMPTTLKAGPQTIRIVNAGKEQHAFEIEGTGVKSQQLPRGDTTQLEVNLKPGSYIIYCPVEGHRGKGMETTVTVQ